MPQATGSGGLASMIDESSLHIGVQRFSFTDVPPELRSASPGTGAVASALARGQDEAVPGPGIMAVMAHQDTALRRPPLDADALTARLVRPGGLWRDIRVVSETGSTNADLLAEAQAGAAEGLVLVAETQTAGRAGWAGPGPARRAPRWRSPCCSAR